MSENPSPSSPGKAPEAPFDFDIGKAMEDFSRSMGIEIGDPIEGRPPAVADSGVEESTVPGIPKDFDYMKGALVRTHVTEPWGLTTNALQGMACLAGFRTETGESTLFLTTGAGIDFNISTMTGRFSFFRIPAFQTGIRPAIKSFSVLDRIRIEVRKAFSGLIKRTEDPQHPGVYEIEFTGGRDKIDRMINEVIEPLVRDGVMRAFDARILGATGEGYGLYSRAEHYIVPTFLNDRSLFIGNSLEVQPLRTTAISQQMQRSGKVTTWNESLVSTLTYGMPTLDLAGISAINRKKGPYLWALRRMGISYPAAILLWLQLKASNAKRLAATDVIGLLARTNYAPLLDSYDPVSLVADLEIINAAFNECAELNPDTFIGQQTYRLSHPGFGDQDIINAMTTYSQTWNVSQVATGAILNKIPIFALPVTSKDTTFHDPVLTYNYWHHGIFDAPRGKQEIRKANFPYIRQLNSCPNNAGEQFGAMNRLDGRIHAQPSSAARIRLATVFPLALTTEPPPWYNVIHISPEYWPVRMTALKQWMDFKAAFASQLFSKWAVALDCVTGPNGYICNVDSLYGRAIRPVSVQVADPNFALNHKINATPFGYPVVDSILDSSGKAVAFKDFFNIFDKVKDDTQGVNITQDEEEIV